MHPLHGVLKLMDSADSQQQISAITALQCLLQDQPECLLDASKGKQYDLARLIRHLAQALDHHEHVVQAAALSCLRAMSDSQACLDAMASTGAQLLEALSKHLGHGVLSDIMKAAWVVTAVQRHAVDDDVCGSASGSVVVWSTSSHKLPGGSVSAPGFTSSCEAAEQNCVDQLVQMLRISMLGTRSVMAKQEYCEAACGLSQLIRHRRMLFGLEAAGKLQTKAGQQGALQLLVQCLSFQDCRQLHATSALASLVWNHYANQAALVHQGSLKALVAICLGACPEAAAAAAACVSNLLHAWPGRPMALASKAALQPLAEALDSASPALQDRAAKALQLIIQ